MDPTLDEAYQADVTQALEGEKGGKGGGGGGSQRVPREAPNTLRSTSKARLIDLVSEGPIVGLADGLQSIYLDDTPLQNEDGSYNFDGVTVHTRDGEPDQDHIPGFPAVETVQDVSAQVTYDTPIVRSVTNLSADAVRVTVQLPALSKQNKSNGDLLGSSVSVAIDVRPDGGSWAEALQDTIKGKTTSPYQRTYRCELAGTGPWEVRVRRLTADSNSAALRNDTYWASYTEVIDAKLRYPDSALVALEVDAQQFGSSIPSRSYDLKGRIIQVPSNYDPATRAYSGVWDGTFQLAWSDNPAWVFYDLATHARYGVGLESVDKWALYAIAQYCDELVPDGYGGQEPRFTFNTQMANAEEAYTALQTLASVFRGMTYWGTNTVMAVADMPAEPVKLVGPANVIDGEFRREGSGLKARHSVALVTWSDPEDGYRQQIEVVEDPDAIQQYGWRQTEVVAAGCTSRGQAHRLGKWILYSERAETETLSYRAGLDHADLRPGELIAVSDPSRAGARLTGRVLAPGTARLTLDAVPDDTSTGTWYLDVVMPSGGIERREVSAFDGAAVDLANPLSVEPLGGAMWVLSSTSVEPEQFRVISVSEEDAHTYAITALAHDPDKFAKVEQGLDLPERETSLVPTGPGLAPTGVDAEAYTYLVGGTEHQGLSISWTPSDDARVLTYRVEVQGPDDVTWRAIYSGAGSSVNEPDAAPGEWQVRVSGLTGLGVASPWVSLVTTLGDLLVPQAPLTVDVSVGTFTVALDPEGEYPGLQWEFWRATTALAEADIEANAVRVAVASQLTDTELTPGTTYYYWIRGANAYGVSDWYPVQATTQQDPTKVMQVISGEIRQSDLYTDLSTNIDALNDSWVVKVDGNGNVGGIGLAYDDLQETIDFGIIADRFWLVDPDDPLNEDFAFIFDNGTLYLREALIQTLTFDKLTDTVGNFVVQNGKLQADYVQADQLQVEWANIQNVAVTSAQIQSLSADKITAGTLSADRIGTGTLQAEKLVLSSWYTREIEPSVLKKRRELRSLTTGTWYTTGTVTTGARQVKLRMVVQTLDTGSSSGTTMYMKVGGTTHSFTAAVNETHEHTFSVSPNTSYTCSTRVDGTTTTHIAEVYLQAVSENFS
ncbi:phage tail protein [Halomonas organivorans]